MGGGGASATPPAPKLVGYQNFVRHNPRSDKFDIQNFHHVEFWCSDATTTYNRFQVALGMTLVAKSDQSTGNAVCASYVLKSHDLVFAFTAPYSSKFSATTEGVPFPSYDRTLAHEFVKSHGLAVRAVGLSVSDAAEAYHTSVANGATGVLPPFTMKDPISGTEQVVSEVSLYGDVVLRYVSGSYSGPFLPGYEAVEGRPLDYGIQRLDHAVGNVPDLLKAVQYIMGFTGFHEFAEFVAEDVGTVDSGLNSMVLANNSETVLLPVNEPTFGTPRKSQIQTYLEQNEGAGLQHMALKTNDIIATLRQMKAVSHVGGFDFMPRPSDKYYRELPSKIGTELTLEQYAACQELGILVDRDDQGILLQIFTRPLGDRPTVFIEIIERLGCMREVEVEGGEKAVEQAAGCGGFGKGNFGELFKSIEDYERTLKI